MASCKSCGAPVIWVSLLPAKRTAPLDRETSITGNIRMLGTRNAVAEVVKKTDLEAERAKGPLYTSHFATCPNAKQHRKPEGAA